MSDRTATDRQRRRFLHTGSKQWRAIRQQVLDREPLCRDCAARGLVTIATEVDHIAGDTADNRLEALMPLCAPCHSHKTACELAGVPLKGCDVNGYPLDPRHPWSVLWNVGGRRD
jgi:5-methylcytosine-specific restriction endonuclease McrA